MKIQDLCLYHLKESFLLITGSAILLISTPSIVGIAGSYLFTLLDTYFQKDGVSLSQRIANYVNRKTQKTFENLVSFKDDYYFVNWILFFITVFPAIIAFAAYQTIQSEFSLLLCIAYNCFRLGPNQIFASWVFALAHKECHMNSQVFKNKFYCNWLNNVYRWFIGILYGLVPQSIYYGHVLNHHKYDNREGDLISSSDRPRDSILNYIKYTTRFSLYSFNMSTIVQFYKEKQFGMVLQIIYGTLYWLGLIAVTTQLLGWKFALGYIVYPSIETNFIFSGFAWGWHAFIDKDDPDNEYINSVTIVDGEFNDLNEGYHVVHHQYPGVHWSQNKELYEKHKDEYYKGSQATMFHKIESYQLFLLIILKRYDIMAEKMANRDDLTIEQKKEFLKSRLNTCTWGPLTNTTQTKFK